VSRLGNCEWTCNACGQVCPTGAIRPLTLEEKQRTIVGSAYIDQNRCIPWADRRDCIVCQEMCPVPEKAIALDDVTVADAAGQPHVLRRPRVLRDRCIGCGICENRCPVPNRAAILVYATSPVIQGPPGTEG
jgi:formate hydrogenlyase subunit 6/NADH:ubiquinone oxidoreductase subunit I